MEINVIRQHRIVQIKMQTNTIGNKYQMAVSERNVCVYVTLSTLDLCEKKNEENINLFNAKLVDERK